MSYGFKIFNWVEDAEKEVGGERSFYETKEVDDYIRSLKAENKRLQRQYLQAVKAANENIAKNVDGNAKYWQDLCEKRTKMYLEEQAAHVAVADELQKQIHKPFPYIEKLEVMKVALLREMAFRARFESVVLLRQSEEVHDFETGNNLYKKSLRRYRQENLFFKKADELEKELKND
jgi:hypothetical protein